MNPESLKTLWAQAFGDTPEMIDLFFSTAYAPQRCRYLADGETAAAALYWLNAAYRGQKFAYIYGVATHPEYRGKGLCRELMAKTHRELAELGYAGAILMPAEPGLRTMYAKMGYRECSTLEEFSCRAGGTVDVRAISGEEYTRLRRRFLPENGLIQEGENITYLQTYAALYAGEDFLLAAVHEKDRLFGLELLGNKAAAPGILRAMGYETGTFRVPGEGLPFAMAISLKENAQMPGYLGLAFD